MAGESSSDAYGTIVTRDRDDSARLNAQHQLYLRAFGYQIHPKIAVGLSEHAKIADIGTGTAIWIQDLAGALPATCEYHGFDLSDEQYPAAASLPANVKLHIHDAKRPFAEQFKGQFDLVHVRLIYGALKKDHDWEDVLRNVAELLKPASTAANGDNNGNNNNNATTSTTTTTTHGGALQWTEPNAAQLALPVRGRPEGTVSALAGAFAQAASIFPVRQYMKYAELPHMFQQAGLKDVGVDIVSSDRLPEDRRPKTEQSIEVVKQLWTVARRNKVPDALSEEQTAQLLQAMYKDMDSGSYYRLDLHTVIGFR